MSNKCMNWAIQEYNPGNQLLKLVVMLMADQADDDGYLFLSQERLATQAGVSERTIRRAVADLESRETLYVIRKRLGTNKSRNAYFLGVPWLPEKTRDKLRKVTQDKLSCVNLSSDTGQGCPLSEDIATSYYPIENPDLPRSSNNGAGGVTDDAVTLDGRMPLQAWAASEEALAILTGVDQIPQGFVNCSELDFHVYYAGAERYMHRGAWDARFMDSVRRRWRIVGKEWREKNARAIARKMEEKDWAK